MHSTLAKLSAFLQTYGPWGIFGLALLDSMGVPLPTATDFVLLTIGITGDARAAYFAAFMALCGSLIGNVLLFQMVRQGRRLVTKEESAPGRFQQWFRQYGLLTVFVPAVVPIAPLPLKVFVISAGAFRTPFARFLAVMVAARVVRYFGLAYLALQLGADAEGFLRRNAWTIIGVALGLALLLAWRMRARPVV
jgi:membrane protein YqaA with SNARE-associated domain